MPKNYKQQNHKKEKRRKKNKKWKQPQSNNLNAEDHRKFVFMLSKFKKMQSAKHCSSDYERFWNIRAMKVCDVCVMNPPFGTKAGNEHIDILFLLIAIKMTKECVYSLHKSSTTKYLVQFLNKFKLGNNGKEMNGSMLIQSIEIVASLKFDVPKMYKFHKQKSKDIQVDLLKIELVH